MTATIMKVSRVCLRLIIIIFYPMSLLLHAFFNFSFNGVFLSLNLQRTHFVAPVSDISPRLCWLLSMTLELIMADIDFIKALQCRVWRVFQPEPGYPAGWLEGLKPREDTNLPACARSGTDSMKDGSHCQGQL